MTISRSHSLRPDSRFRPAFSLVEVLLAIFILGIGMIMVASVFPVGANWTRQTAEESVGQTVAQNALTVLQKHYGRGGDLSLAIAPDFMSATNVNSVLKAASPSPDPAIPGPYALQAFPFFTSIPVRERCYQFGSNSPFPATNPLNCTYFWTALIRLNPAYMVPSAPVNFVQLSSSYKYDVFILVMHKGDVRHSFFQFSTEIPGMRNLVGPAAEQFIPSVQRVAYSPGTYLINGSPQVQKEVPRLGDVALGGSTGTVFRQMLDPYAVVKGSGPAAMPRPFIRGYNLAPAGPLEPLEPIIYCPPADGTGTSNGAGLPPYGASPLIYVYQTTVTF